MRVLSLKNGKVIEEDLTKLMSERINLSDPVSWYICEFGNKLLELEAENKRLERDSRILRALEAGGVDNWEWYGESLKEIWEEEDV